MLKKSSRGCHEGKGDLGSYNTGDSCAPLTSLKRGSVKKTLLKRRVKKGCVPDKISGLCAQTHFANAKGQQFTFCEGTYSETQLTLHKKAGSERLTDYTKILRLEVGLSSDQLKIPGTHC